MTTVGNRTYWPYLASQALDEAHEALEKMLREDTLTEDQWRSIERAQLALQEVYDASSYDAEDRSRYFVNEDIEDEPVLVPETRLNVFGKPVCTDCGYHPPQHDEDCSRPMVPAVEEKQ